MASQNETDFQYLKEQLEKERQARKESDKARDEEVAKVKKEAMEEVAKVKKEAMEEAAKVKKEAMEEVAKVKKEAMEEAAKADKARDEEVAKAKKESLNQNTTFPEYLQVCHKHLHEPMGIETNKTLTTVGFTKLQKKFYPEALRPWEDFASTQDNIFDAILRLFGPSEQLFNSNSFIESLGQNYCHVRLANEMSLRSYEHIAVEGPVSKILTQISKHPHAEKELGFDGKGTVDFENSSPFTTNSLSPKTREVQDRLQNTRPLGTPPQCSQFNTDSDIQFKPDLTHADQYCVYKTLDDSRELLFIIEYKPPHKLSASDLQRGFRPMHLKEVIDRTTIPLPIKEIEENFDKELAIAGQRKQKIKQAEENRERGIEERLQYNSDKLVGAVATQTFHYMIENGLEYSYITTGETFVFLRILADDPKTLYYHVAVPVNEIRNSLGTITKPHTAVARVVTLCIMAFQSPLRNHIWRHNAKNQLEKYPGPNYEALLRETPKDERKRKKALPDKGGRSVRSRYDLRPRDPSPPDAGGDIAGASSSQSGAARNGSTGQQQKDGSTTDKNLSSSSQGTQRQYCTQKCLLGLTRRLSLDKDCPNTIIHPNRNGKHAIDIFEFMYLIQQQLAQDLDHNCKPLGLQGARGALFKITLASHGYVFVGKGTVYAFVPDLLHEGRVYERLEPLQGIAVPVYLGNIDLKEMYYLDVGVRIQHMLLLSWAGTAIKDISNFEAQVKQTVSEVGGEGIDQGDIRPPNLLWNHETDRIMLIDFERANITATRPVEASLSKRCKPLESVVHRTRRVRRARGVK